MTKSVPKYLPALLFAAGMMATGARGQDSFDPNWYDATRQYVKIGTVEDGIHHLSGEDLSALGIPIASVDPATIQIFQGGKEVPVLLEATGGSLQSTDTLRFVGFRNTGEDEDYLYNFVDFYRSSRFHSLFSDTTWSWLTWGREPGLRYGAFQNPAIPQSRTSFRNTLRLEQENTYYGGDGIDIGNPLYTNREGYYWTRVVHNTNPSTLTRSFETQLDNWTTADTDTAVVRVRLNSQTTSPHEVRLELRLFDGSSSAHASVDTVSWNGLSLVTLEARVPQNAIPPDGNLRVRLISRNDFGSSIPNNWYLDWIQVEYQQSLTATGTTQLSIPVGTGDFEFELSGLDSGDVFVLDPSVGEGVERASDGAGNLTIEVTRSSPSRIFVAPRTAILRPIVAADSPSDLVNTSNAAGYVIVHGPSLQASANALAEHRATVEGGSHQVMKVSVQDIFDQFDYGRPTPIAIRRFFRAAAEWQTPPQFVIFWGDALYPDKDRPRFSWEVPSFGNTASDGWFAMQNAGITDYTESIAIGRVPVRSNTDGQLFVDKISTYEAAPAERWQKNALYLVGGATDIERRLLQSNALQWSSLVAGFPTALDTTNFFKATTEALDPTFKDSIQQALTTGASWVTYFGHSAAQTWEIVTDPPAMYNNANRLPMVLSLGCFTGNYALGDGSSQDERSFSEQLVLDNLNGGIGHWGASSSGTIGASAALSAEVHQSVFADSMRVLGLALRAAKTRFASRFSDPLSVKHALQYGLIGDPATTLSLPVQPEFVVSPSSIALTPVAPIPADSNLTARVRVDNHGLAPADSVLIRTTRTRPDGSVQVEDRLVEPFGLRRDLEYQLPIDDSAIGEHVITVEADANARYDELNELDNVASRSITVFATGVALLEPVDFGLVNTTSPELRVVVARQDAADVPMIIQLAEDTAFDPLDTQELRVSTPDLLVKWSPGGLQDNMTYYWRARVDDGSDAIWQVSRFTIDTSATGDGWLQSGSLFDSNSGDGLVERVDDKWRLRDFELDVSASSERGSGAWLGQFVVSGERLERLTLGFGLLVIDGKTGSVKSHTSAAPYPNDFVDSSVQFDSLEAQVARISPGDYIFTRTRHLGNKAGIVEIADSVKTIFRALESTAIDTLTYQDLWIMMSRKGFPSETREWVEPPGTVNEILRDTTLTFTLGRGITASPGIGPSREWQTLKWQPQLAHPDNRIYLTVRSSATDEALLSAAETVLSPDPPVYSLDLSDIDPKLHPLLSLEAEFVDSTNSGTPQLLSWSILYDPVAELAVDRFRSTVSSDTLQEGEALAVSTVVTNLSSSIAEAAFLDYYATEAGNQRSFIATDTLGLMTADTTFTVTREIETRGRGGANVIETRIRQDGFTDGISYNNLSVAPFLVRIDGTAPDLEVTIDGEAFPPDPEPVVNLQDPALPFVDLHPAVEIVVQDENQFIPLEGDTTIVRVTLDGNEVPFTELSQLPAKKGELVRFMYEPSLAERDTVHTLIVEAFDGSGNPAADNPYQVHFRTQTAVQLEGVYPYPNPMNTSTTFAFRLRGADTFTIDDFRLRIYTINGRVVREFDLVDEPSALDAGALRIGWNKVRWDGRDEDGDLVATGVYLYQVFVRNEGQELDLGSMSKVEKVVVIR